MKLTAALLGATALAAAVAALAPARAAAADPRIAGVTADVSVVYDFNYPAADARTPTQAGIIRAFDGRIYGVGETGGECANGGAVYSIGIGETQDTLVHSFPCDTNHQFIAGEGLGYEPYRGGIVDGGDGYLYGTTLYSYDPTALGDVYRVHPDGSNFQIVHRWSTTSDAPGDHYSGNVTPTGRLLLASDGYLYGVTHTGGRCGLGSIYRLDRSSLAYKTVYSFCHESGVDDLGANPLAGLIQGPDGALYGTTELGGATPGTPTDTPGTVFRLTVDAAGTGTVTTIHSFNGFDGKDPQAALYLASDGHMYGTTAIGNENNNGTVFRIDPDGTFAVVHEFGQGWGHVLYNGVVEGPGGFLYGVTWGGGQYNFGTVFVLDQHAAANDTSAVNFLYSFNADTEGGGPFGDLLPVGGGTFYGTNQSWGPNCSVCGTLWKVHFAAPPLPDTASPTVTCGSADGLWHAADVSISCTASDGGSGLNDPGDASFMLVTSVPAGAVDPNAATGSHQVCDKAGNCVTVGPIRGNMVDKEPPTITITVPGGTYTAGSSVAADYGCTDHSGSGLKTCAGPVASGASVDTGTTGPHSLTVTAVDNVGNTASKTVTYTVVAADTTTPTCQVTATGTDTAGRKYVEFTTADAGSGLRTIAVTTSTNATTQVPAFTVGTTAAVVVRSTKINQSLSSQIALRVTDVAGNLIDCDPVSTSIIRDPGGDAPATQSFGGLAQGERFVTITNGDPGLRKITLTVNGVRFVERSLAPGERRTFDIGAAMHPGSDNTVVLSGKGDRKGAGADVLISDS